MCAEMDPSHVTDLPHSPTTLMPNEVLYEVYVTYAECAGGPSVAHIKMTLEGMKLCFFWKDTAGLH